ncbi:MAG TPA: hypothetical protein VMU84_05045 [Thermoanaerobaculia bacterium]|nr:hypothetical protein [Thermoanaerobaculia bacterium]
MDDHGDYTKERHKIFSELTIDQLLEAIDERERVDPADAEQDSEGTRMGNDGYDSRI